MTDEELPSGWAEAPLGSLARYLNGRAFSSKTWSTTGRPIIRIQNLTGSGNSFNHFDGELEERHIIRRGDLLVSWAATLGVFVWDGPEAALNQHIFKVLPFINPSYLRYAMTAALDEMYRKTHGSGMVHITKGAFDAVVVPVAPEAEQQRIVDELERRLSHVDAAVTGLNALLRRMEAARRSILAAAADGSLVAVESKGSFSDVCREHGVSGTSEGGRAGWAVVRIGDIATVGSGGTPKRGNKKYWENGTVPWVTSGQIPDGTITSPAELVTEVALRETSVKLWPAGTLLVAMYGEGRTRGHCAELAIDACCNQACAAIRMKAPFEPWKPFLKLTFGARYEHNRELGKGGVQENLNLGLVKDMAVPLPPEDVRDILVAEAERRLSLINVAEKTVVANLRKAKDLRRSLLGAAFSGRLVPHHPADEPADVLLRRLKTRGQADIVNAPKGARKSRAMKAKEPAA